MTDNRPHGGSSYISQVRPQAGKVTCFAMQDKLNQPTQTEPDFER
jgi:hypothetical protein